jgi:hypothetical protein
VRNRTRRNAEELAALLDGSLSSKDVTGETRRLAALATTVVEERPGPVATLTQDRRLAMRDRLMDDIAALDAPPAAVPARTGRARRSTRAAIASGVASALIAGTGVTVAAQEALPGDLLYGLKKGTESVRMSLAGDATQAARLELRFAEERLDEVTEGLRRIPADSLVESLVEMDRRSIAGARQLVLDAERTGEGELLIEVDDFVERQSTGLVEIFPRLPIEVRPHAEDSLATLRAIRFELLLPAMEACDCVDVVPAGFSDGDFVSRLTSDPLPPRPAQDEAEETSRADDGSGTSSTTTTDTDLDEPLEDLTSETTTSEHGVRSRLSEPLSRTTDTAEDTTRKTTDAVQGTVDETTKTLDETVEDTTKSLDKTVEDTTESVGDFLGSTTDSITGSLGF